MVVPSLPGYGFSTPLTTSGINFWRTADLWVRLMQDVLGYDTFAAQGGDWGAIITAQLGHKYADKLIGTHVNLMVPLSVFVGSLPDESQYGPGEEGWYERSMHFLTAETGRSGCVPGFWKNAGPGATATARWKNASAKTIC